jgi:hypothetical protein
MRSNMRSKMMGKFWVGPESHNIYNSATTIFKKMKERNMFSPLSFKVFDKNAPNVKNVTDKPHKKVILSEEMQRSLAFVESKETTSKK